MSTFLAPPPAPKTDLGKPRILSPTAGLKVSPLCLGAMSIGEAWKEGMGSMNKEQSFKLLDAFYEAGGNFIDTANNYQDEESETWIGDWMHSRGIRDQIVIATKFTSNYRAWELGKSTKSLNYTGNNMKSMHVSVRDSLRKLQTDYIDILYVHWWEWTTSIEELMNGLHALVESGKVLYLGISDTPAWVVSAANTYAKAHAKTPFCIYQGRWNVMVRDFERDIIPMARQFGMALAPWDVLGGGKFQTKAHIKEREAAGERLRSMRGMSSNKQSPQEEKMSEALEKVANELGVDSIQAVALAYVMQKTNYVFPIVGGRKVEYLHDNIKALGIHLSDKQIAELESVTPFDHGFPISMVGNPYGGVPGIGNLQNAHLEFQLDGKPIGHQ